MLTPDASQIHAYSRTPTDQQDGGGLIDYDEFETFWNTYNFEIDL